MPNRTVSIPPLLLTVSQVAKLIGFGRTKAYDMVRAGKIPSIQIEGKIRVTRKALDAWIEKQS